MVNFQDQLKVHLDGFVTAPFLFVGSGFSRRYAGSEDWTGLLKLLAEPTGKPYERYVSSANGDLPKAASLIAADFHDVWWDSPDFAESRALYPTPPTKSSPFKIEVARLLEGITSRLPDEGELNLELEALRDAVVEGIITTNFDTILEYVFPDFAPYIGQDELLFRDPYGVAEIYKIHGSSTRPESIVITEEDFSRFNDRNPYLAAKLLTVFVEHPVIFLGYSLTDDNVRQVINSIASILTEKNLHQLKDRLIFVSWDATIDGPTMVASQFSIGQSSIPIHLVTVPRFLEVFQVLGTLKRRFPARILRHLKEQVYELVRTSEPGKTVAVADLESDTDVQAVDVVIGVGVSQRLESQGIVGLSRRDLVEDVLTPRLPKSAHAEIVEKVIPRIASGKTHVPMYLYLRGAGLLDDDGGLSIGSKVDARIRARVRLGASPLVYTTPYYIKKVANILTTYTTLQELLDKAPLSDALLAIPNLHPKAVSVPALRKFLVDNASVIDGVNQWDATQWFKCVCFYDIVANKSKRRIRRPTTSGVTRKNGAAEATGLRMDSTQRNEKTP